MSKLNTPLDVYKLLPKSNCGKCFVSSCMAFSAAVIKQEKRLSDCPCLDKNISAQWEEKIAGPVSLEKVQEEQLRALQGKISKIDLTERAEIVAGRSNGCALVISCLGRDFEIDKQGAVKSLCHTHAWFSIPLLDYVLHSSGESIAGKWLPFRELKQGSTWSRLFEQRCEKPLKEIADSHPELFADLVSMFSGISSFNNFSSDISVVLYPLPKVPVLICYWKPEDDLESRLHLFFDGSAEKHLHIDSLFTLATGLVRMFEKIMLKHAPA